MSRYDYLIVGAGFAGSVCARQLADAGKRVLLIDQRSHVGGNAYDEPDAHGVLVHRYGAHIFHTNSWPIFQYLSRFTEWRGYQHKVLAVYDGQLVPVPINRETLRAFNGSLLAAFEALYRPYTWKQWGCQPETLDPSVLARVQVRDSEDDRYFTDQFQAMPRDGYTALFLRLLDHPSIDVQLSTPHEKPLAAETIWTGPIDAYFQYEYGRLPYRSASFEFKTEIGNLLQPVGVLNYPAYDVPYTRSIEFKHLTGQSHAYTTIALETPSVDGEPYWPVPNPANRALYERYRERAAQTPGVHFCGRLGSYQYLDMHQVVGQALALSERLLVKESVCRHP